VVVGLVVGVVVGGEVGVVVGVVVGVEPPPCLCRRWCGGLDFRRLTGCDFGVALPLGLDDARATT
jgi:hypothetical protein